MIRVLIILLLLATPASACDIRAYFSPTEPIAPIILTELNHAMRSIHCSLFGISHPDLAQALIEAQQRGVEVIVGLDRKQASLASDLHALLRRHGVRVVIKLT